MIEQWQSHTQAPCEYSQYMYINGAIVVKTPQMQGRVCLVRAQVLWKKWGPYPVVYC